MKYNTYDKPYTRYPPKRFGACDGLSLNFRESSRKKSLLNPKTKCIAVENNRYSDITVYNSRQSSARVIQNI